MGKLHVTLRTLWMEYILPKEEIENLDTLQLHTCGIEYANKSFLRGGLESSSLMNKS